jgi:hypothetical protein
MDGGGVTLPEGDADAAEGRRVEELLRVNGELAAELRALAAGRAQQPRASQVPAARSVARLLADLETRTARLEAAEAELEATRADRDRLELQNREMAAEIARLSAGLSGLTRRLRGRLLSRAGGGGAPAPRGR